MLWCYGVYDKAALAHTQIQALIILFDVPLRASCYGVYDRRADAHNLLFNKNKNKDIVGQEKNR
jgi:hypothetical protein